MNQRATSEMTASCAQICRDLDWGPGTVLRGVLRESEQRICRLLITAVGETHVLARELRADDGAAATEFLPEFIWDLRSRDWERV